MEDFKEILIGCLFVIFLVVVILSIVAIKIEESQDPRSYQEMFVMCSEPDGFYSML